MTVNLRKILLAKLIKNVQRIRNGITLCFKRPNSVTLYWKKMIIFVKIHIFKYFTIFFDFIILHFVESFLSAKQNNQKFPKELGKLSTYICFDHMQCLCSRYDSML